MDSGKLTKPCIVLDFDGTMCRLFKNYDLKATARIISERLKKYGVDFDCSLDAFDAFAEITRQTKSDGVREAAFIEADGVLTAAEIEALDCAESVSGVEEILPELVSRGFGLGIASNNSAAVIKAFLASRIPALNVPVAGRVPARPDLMKPHTSSLEIAAKELGCPLADVLFIGDTRRDYECAVNAGCKFIGMAPTRIKVERLSVFLSQDRIVTDYYALAALTETGI